MGIQKSEIYKKITGKEGFCRHITFGGVNWLGIESFIQKVADLYSSIKCLAWQPKEYEPIEVDYKDILNSLKKAWALAEIYVEDTNNILQQLQIDISVDEDVQPLLELTYYPEDINLEPENIDSFINLVEDWYNTLKAKTFFVRYTNGMWDFGDASQESGVIYTSNMDFE